MSLPIVTKCRYPISLSGSGEQKSTLHLRQALVPYSLHQVNSYLLSRPLGLESEILSMPLLHMSGE